MVWLQLPVYSRKPPNTALSGRQRIPLDGAVIVAPFSSVRFSHLVSVLLSYNRDLDISSYAIIIKTYLF